MFNIGDTIVYGNQGVFNIENIIQQNIGGTAADYFLLRSSFDSRTVIYVPCGNEMLLSRMRNILSIREVNSLIDSIPRLDDLWIDNEAARIEKHKAILSSGDRTQILSLISTLYRHKADCQEKGKKMHQKDERIFKEAERLIYDEFALVLGISQKDVVSYISQKLENK